MPTRLEEIKSAEAAVGRADSVLADYVEQVRVAKKELAEALTVLRNMIKDDQMPLPYEE